MKYYLQKLNNKLIENIELDVVRLIRYPQQYIMFFETINNIVKKLIKSILYLCITIGIIFLFKNSLIDSIMLNTMNAKEEVFGVILCCAVMVFLYKSFCLLCDIAFELSDLDLIHYDEKYNKKIFYFNLLIHNIVYNQRNRNDEIVIFLQYQSDNAEIRSIQGEIILFKDFVQEVCDIFNRKEKSFIKFLNEIYKDYSEYENGVSTISLWILSLPRNYSLDCTKELIKLNKYNILDYDKLKNISKQITIKRMKVGWDELFKNYNESEIKRFFRVFPKGKDYLGSLNILKNYKEELIKFVSLKDFCLYVKDNEESFKYNIKLNQINNFDYLNQLELNVNDYVNLKVIDCPLELYEWGKSLKHCVSVYKRRIVDGQSCILGILKDNKIYGNIELNKKGDIIQIKGMSNGSIEEELLIREHIKKCLLKK